MTNMNSSDDRNRYIIYITALNPVFTHYVGGVVSQPAYPYILLLV